MIKRTVGYACLLFATFASANAQVDTTYIHSNNKPYGSLDLRIAKSSTHYYYLQENKTFSFRESSPGVKTDKYLDMTSWDSSPYMEGNLRENDGTSDNFVMNYRLLLPEGYNAGYTPGYPLIIVFHGLGESGNCWDQECHHADKTYSPITNTPPAPTDSTGELLNNDHQLSNGGNAHLAARNRAGSKLPDDPTLNERDFPGFVLFPQNLNGWDITSTQDAIRILRLVMKKYNIDEDRVYIHGLSNGGQGVYEAIKRAPWMFAAAATMSPIGDANILNQGMAPAVAHIPLWVFQGGQDQNPYPQKTENYIKQFRDAGMVVRYTKYPDLGHGTWGTAYNEPDFFSWFLNHNKANLHVYSGSATICSSEGLQLELPAGYFAYQWQHNGATIDGATGPTYMATEAGIYRARFSRVAGPTEEQWNQWSNEIEVTGGIDLPQASIEQVGTVLLNDLNDNANAVLRAKGEYSHYYWYKDGNLIDFPGTQDDTIRLATITPGMGNGLFTLITSNFSNCMSAASEGKYIFFNNSAPVNITSPANFQAVANGPEVTVSWTDASSDETGFEIWRRKQLSSTSFSSWEMATLTDANATSFSDFVLPESVYEYKIRAVSNSGRSDYFPTASAVTVNTGYDTEPPTAPMELTATAIGVQKFELSWTEASDNTTLKDYVVFYGSDSVSTGLTDTVYVLENVPLNQTLTLYVRARDIAGNLSDQSNAQEVSTFVSGLFYEHSTGAVNTLDSIDWTHAEFTGVVPTFTLTPKTQEDYFNFRFDGFVYITNEGDYQFRTSSNDGSHLRINDELQVNNDGVHDLATVESEIINLAVGAHRINVDFFDHIGTDTLGVQYKGPDTNNEWSNFDPAVLVSHDSLITSINPDNGPEDSFRLSIFPNPSTQENINVRIETAIIAPVSIQLLDPVGRRVFHEEFSLDGVGMDIRLAPPGVLHEGIYFIIATQGNVTARQRVVIRN